MRAEAARCTLRLGVERVRTRRDQQPRASEGAGACKIRTRSGPSELAEAITGTDYMRAGN